MSDIDAPGLVFVDPDETLATYRVALFAPPGSGKSVAAASAPTPILLVSADRPAAYAFARKVHNLDGRLLREVRYQDPSTLEHVFRYLASPDGADVRTVIVDPVGNVYDALRDVAPKGRDGDPDYAWINGKLFGFIKALRRFDVHVVLVAHEKLNDGKKGDGKIYPQFGGLTLINKILGELDMCAHIDRVLRPVEGEDEPQPVWVGQLQPRDGLVCKESTGSLGDRRVANLSRWFEVAAKSLARDESDVPWGDGYVAPEPEPAKGNAKAKDSVKIDALEDEAFKLLTLAYGQERALTMIGDASGSEKKLRALIAENSEPVA